MQLHLYAKIITPDALHTCAGMFTGAAIPKLTHFIYVSFAYIRGQTAHIIVLFPVEW